MANGDAAAAAGMDVVAGTDDIKLSYDEINKSRDYIAQFATNIPASAIVSGTFATARIPALDASKITSGLLGVGQIPALPASTITSGTFGNARLASGIDASKITVGNLDLGGVGFVRGSSLVTPGALTAAGVRLTNLSGFQSVVTNASGAIGVATSSRRYKQNIVSAELRSGLLTPGLIKRYRYRVDVRELGDEAPTYIGVIAEDLDDLGLYEYVVYNDKGQPQSVHYELLVLDLIQIVQAHDIELAAVRARLDTLEQKDA